MSRIFCWFGFHRPMPGCTRERAIVYVCCRCGALERGDMGTRGRS
jgi:hypothetical protein